MKRCTLLFLTLLLATIPLARADEASKNAKIEEFLKAAKLEQLMGQMLTMAANQMKSAAVQQMTGTKLSEAQRQSSEEFQSKMMKIIGDALSWDAMKPIYVKLYADAYTEDEIDGILAFYKSPAGQAMVSKTPQLMAQANRVAMQRMATVQPELQKLVNEYKSRSTTPTTEKH